MMETRNWYVVNTKARNEERAALNLAQGGIDVLAPKLRFRRWREGKFTDIIEPMFPGYIFVKFHPVDEFRLVKYTRGIKTIVNFNGRIIPLQEGLVDYIRERLTEGVATVEKRTFQKGEKIIIQEGPFKGFSGIFEQELDGRERIAILLEGVDYCARMEIDRELVTKA
ncbi:MAG TPA: transcription/translation regulatory transformer protein RfaH [Deltaproteobacteria bacterium]|nr:transcription/translation regulatory transformer protein RfaH [Deltaproteobacteria bacterium]